VLILGDFNVQGLPGGQAGRLPVGSKSGTRAAAPGNCNALLACPGNAIRVPLEFSLLAPFRLLECLHGHLFVSRKNNLRMPCQWPQRMHV